MEFFDSHAHYDDEKFNTLSPDLQQKMLELQTMTEKTKENDFAKKAKNCKRKRQRKEFVKSFQSFLITRKTPSLTILGLI